MQPTAAYLGNEGMHDRRYLNKKQIAGESIQDIQAVEYIVNLVRSAVDLYKDKIVLYLEPIPKRHSDSRPTVPPDEWCRTSAAVTEGLLSPHSNSMLPSFPPACLDFSTLNN